MTRWARAFRALVLTSVAVLCCTNANADTVIRRGAAEELRGRATFDDAGVTVRSDSGARIFVPWDRVRKIYTDQRVPGLEGRLEVAEDLWRARSRLERGDARLAEPLFGSLFARYRGQTHETALVVAEGLLRCCVARGAQAEAVIPALESIRIRRAGIDTGSYAMLPTVIDAHRDLCIQVAPFWVADRNLLALDRDLDRYDSKGDRVVGEIASLYHIAVRRQLGGPNPSRGTSDESSHAGIQFLRQIVAASSPEADAQMDVQAELSQRIDELPPWAQAWARIAIGSGLLGHSDQTARDRGLVQLAYLPARYGPSQPFLAGLALDRIKLAMEERGEAEAADAIELELKRRFPGHPLLLNRRDAFATPATS